MALRPYGQLVSTRFTARDGLPEGEVARLAAIGKRVVAETARGAAEFDGKKWRGTATGVIHAIPPDLTVADLPSGERVTSWAQTRFGKTWVVTTRCRS